MKNTLKYMLILPYVTQSLIMLESAPSAKHIFSINTYAKMHIKIPAIVVAPISIEKY